MTTFLLDEADANIRKLILDSIDRLTGQDYRGVRKFEFNRFDVSLDFENGEVTLTDDLTVGPAGEFTTSMQEFGAALRAPSQSSTR
ncbi:hypothetical protein JJE66_34250 [Bradyrhizobium diazoefficiens]|uniref:hypothetical protein n=1 Tax=Bradyrhizobium diazoefficiens TaxID=1355477 RepID=UPI0019099FCD|nr:hypothetical protein [Bradyrhizobium diazoefficiens]MBK3666267.1 hypothetical protein [Bradyrhizobium diazoefficiens]